MIKSISDLKKTKKKILILHYSCTSVNIPPVIVTNISVRDFSLNQTFSFSFARYGHEHNLLLAFLNYMKKQKNYLLLTWNQKSSTYGIQHLEERCRHYGIHKNLPINYKNVLDLDDSLIDKYGPNYAPHSKLDNLAKTNNISMLGAESGLFEIELFKRKEYKRIENSTNRKVAMMADILRLATSNSLKTSTRKVTSSMLTTREIPAGKRIASFLPSTRLIPARSRMSTIPTSSVDRNNLFRTISSLHRTVAPELKSLRTNQKFKPGLYYLVWADLSDSNKIIREIIS